MNNRSITNKTFRAKIEEVITKIGGTAQTVNDQHGDHDILSVDVFNAGMDRLIAALTKVLPACTTADNGKVLKVDAGVAKWMADSMPACTAEDNGDVLTVVEGAPAWQSAAQG